MKVFQIVGVRNSGKTTTVEVLIKKLKQLNFSVATIKFINCPFFKLDSGTKITNTQRHRIAGADIVIAAGKKETDVMYSAPLDINDMLNILQHNNVDFCIVEGGYEADLPRIICARSEDEIEERSTENTFAVSGVLADTDNISTIYPVFSGLTHSDELIDLILKSVKQIHFPVKKIKRPSSCQGNCDRCMHTKINK